jgi:hypothetical protein
MKCCHLLLRLDIEETQGVHSIPKVRQNFVEKTVGLKKLIFIVIMEIFFVSMIICEMTRLLMELCTLVIQ